ncbi:hypothetical protein PBI_CHE12_98 [Mycobacterium phage Che12]|uniref:DUF7273 domain-containing protein n=1 Tax=Mycobacterium phage Che12 TaxID=2911435 RepID=Q1A0B9_9CAUD|nr:gp98 [Mycobacterium phage Che12]ABE67417.1 hypothetical protein PBI_CHE12_98 [Mycobacterium phage Che12]
MQDTDENRVEIAQELHTVANLHDDQGNAEYARALRHRVVECIQGEGDIEDYARILGKAEEAL